MTFGSLFSGCGGLDLGLELAGHNCIWQCENDQYATSVLAKRWPEVKRYGDITKTDWQDAERPELICGGDPCQGNSNAANVHKRDHADMGSEFIAVVETLRPRFVLRENPSVVKRDAPWPWHRFRRELHRLGYHVLPFRLRACCVGHDHKRERLFMFAESSDTNSQRPQWVNREGMPLRIASGVCGDELRSTQDLLPSPRICGAGDGIPHRVDRLRVIGNAVDVRVGMVIGLAMMRAIQ